MSLETDIKFDYAQLSDVKLHYATAGDGEDLVILLHGFPEFWYSWRHQIPALAEFTRVVAPDLRGYNLSDKPSETSEYEIEKLVGDVIGLIDHFGCEKAALVGHDWGAAITWATAARFPDRVSKIACLQVPPPQIWKRNQTRKQLLASWYMFFFQMPKIPEWRMRKDDFALLASRLKTTTASRGVFTDEDIERYKESWHRRGALTGALNYYRANVLKRILGKPDPSSQDKIKVPTLFIYGEQDHAILPETVEGVGDAIHADYTEIRIPEAAHWVQLEAKEKVTEALKEFLF